MNSSENETEHNKTTSNINEFIHISEQKISFYNENHVRYLIETDGSIASHGIKRQECPWNGRPMSNCLTIVVYA